MCRVYLNNADSSYAALGLLPSIPLPTGASSSKMHRAPINLPSTSASTSNEGEETPKVSYGRIIRDDEGNVIDIILDDEEEDNGSKEVVEEGREALNPEKEWVPERVEAKTDVVRCESCSYFYFLVLIFCESSTPPSYQPTTTCYPLHPPCISIGTFKLTTQPSKTYLQLLNL